MGDTKFYSFSLYEALRADKSMEGGDQPLPEEQRLSQWQKDEMLETATRYFAQNVYARRVESITQGNANVAVMSTPEQETSDWRTAKELVTHRVGLNVPIREDFVPEQYRNLAVAVEADKPVRATLPTHQQVALPTAVAA